MCIESAFFSFGMADNHNDCVEFAPLIEYEVYKTSKINRNVMFHGFFKRLLHKNFYTENYMKSFCPVSVDAERLFPLCSHSRTNLQCRMTVEKHRRNLFICKNKSFMPEKSRTVLPSHLTSLRVQYFV